MPLPLPLPLVAAAAAAVPAAAGTRLRHDVVAGGEGKSRLKQHEELATLLLLLLCLFHLYAQFPGLLFFSFLSVCILMRSCM